jgi:hypothetical protein
MQSLRPDGGPGVTVPTEASPNSTGLNGNHGVAVLAGENLLELFHVLNYAVGAKLSGRVRVGPGRDA